jgi:hypothetical protein
MGLQKSRYQQGSITRILRASGYAWRVRFSERSAWPLRTTAPRYPPSAKVKRTNAIFSAERILNEIKP